MCVVARPRVQLLSLILLALIQCQEGQGASEGADHWTYQAYDRPEIPVVRSGWIANPIDSFILTKLRDAGIKPAKPANADTLIRRIQLDLIGLPPSVEDVNAFRNSHAVDPQFAIRALVDRLLASPHYGERWGRHWLDLARYAETDGFEHDAVRPHSWRYRDYVIDSFNADKPYDRFAREQIAGDEFWPGEPQALIATGFNLLGPDMVDSSDQVQRRLNTLNDMTDTTSSVFLGLTLGCAKCHDHPFEPVSQREYYQVQAFYTPVDFIRDRSVPTSPERRKFEADVRRYESHPDVRKFRRFDAIARSRLEARQGKRKFSTREIIRSLSSAQKKERMALEKKISGLRKPYLPKAMTIAYPRGDWKPTHVLHRGDYKQPRDEVAPAFPHVVGSSPASARSRRELADWITTRSNPRTARVIVNRIWRHHFGRGLVDSSSEWGVNTPEPRHLDLLNWLADEFIRRNWSVKEMHRLILMSATYRQSILAHESALRLDHENRLFSRWSPLRLEGEIVRDSLLALGGELNATMHGRSVFPPIPAELFRGAKGWTVSKGRENHVRRSIYIFARRNLRFPFLEVFDAPDSNLSCAERETSTTAPQSLTLLNADDVVNAANKLAGMIERLHDETNRQAMYAYRRILGRPPTSEERAIGVEFLATSPLSELCRALFNVNEFVYVN